MTNAFIFTKCHQVNKANNILTVKTTSNNTLLSGDALTTGHSTKSFLCSHMLCAIFNPLMFYLCTYISSFNVLSVYFFLDFFLQTIQNDINAWILLFSFHWSKNIFCVLEISPKSCFCLVNKQWQTDWSQVITKYFL